MSAIRYLLAVFAAVSFGVGNQCPVVADDSSVRINTLPLRKLMDTPLRDTSICRGPDGTWYMTVTRLANWRPAVRWVACRPTPPDPL